MPELPEVEIVRRTLEPHLLGRRIVGLKALWEKSLVISEPARALFSARPAWLILGLKRRGKLLLVELGELKDGPPRLFMGFHLKMTGQVLVKPAGAEPGRHTRLIFQIENDNGISNSIFFDDMRKFGFCRVMLPEEMAEWSFLRKLGPEPLEIEAERFAACFCRPEKGADGKDILLSGRVKNLLMNQEVVAGVGNIYADEALFRAGIRPDRPVCELNKQKLLCLAECVQEVLRLGIAAGGSSIRDYLDADGKAGAFQEEFQVYGRKGQPCPRCGRALEHMKLAGRSTVFCSFCQS
ncbi:MAG: bifunctional DNA-formamidopyrimidine glycosylase/DNA-(apurinic or apyrimidinic site) lyase [Desulfovibrionaceae bacterium]|nr:bifunctional DNA-formamidopyrimidine glycosylase/DNA-(apurinic or apyrimidinic site) lyase [Desulfovibrionaceae bacterium]